VVLIPIILSIHGSADIFEDIDKTYVYSINEMPYNQGVPDKNIQKSGHISGWIDVVGFRQMIKDNEDYYVPGRPSDYSILQYDTWADLKECSTCFVIYIKNKVSVSNNELITTAKNNIELKWAEIITNCDKNGCWQNTITQVEKAIFSDSDISPKQFSIPANQNIIVNMYGGVFPKKIINIKDIDNRIISYKIETENGSLFHSRRIGKIETTPKGVFFMKLIPMSIWNNTGTGIYNLRDDPILGNETITGIVFNTAYGASKINYTMVYTKNKETSINPGVLCIIFIVIAFFSGIRIMNKWSRL
jgi:hypothetical protein